MCPYCDVVQKTAPILVILNDGQRKWLYRCRICVNWANIDLACIYKSSGCDLPYYKKLAKLMPTEYLRELAKAI